MGGSSFLGRTGLPSTPYTAPLQGKPRGWMRGWVKEARGWMRGWEARRASWPGMSIALDWPLLPFCTLSVPRGWLTCPGWQPPGSWPWPHLLTAVPSEKVGDPGML